MCYVCFHFPRTITFYGKGQLDLLLIHSQKKKKNKELANKEVKYFFTGHVHVCAFNHYFLHTRVFILFYIWEKSLIMLYTKIKICLFFTSVYKYFTILWGKCDVCFLPKYFFLTCDDCVIWFMYSYVVYCMKKDRMSQRHS